jgi:hypothetical protein
VTEMAPPQPDGKPKKANPKQPLLRQNLRAAERTMGHSLPPRLKSSLHAITQEWGFSLDRGEVLILSGSCYVTHTGLLRLASRKRCCGMQVETVDSLCDSAAHRFVLRATVYPSKDSVGFVGYGDADPSNVSALVQGAELRMAETRAVNRALRKAYGIGLCSAEEMGSSSNCNPVDNPGRVQQPVASGANGKGNGSKVRDRLCQVIRQHQLDPALVKAYAVDFCGSESLKDAPREQVETFVQQLTERAVKDRPSLLCLLNSYTRSSDEVIA